MSRAYSRTPGSGAAGTVTPSGPRHDALPTVAAGPGISAGSPPSGVSLNQTDTVSDDFAGQVLFGSGSAVNAAGDALFTVTFGTPFTAVPVVDLQAGNQTTAGRGIPWMLITDATTTGFTARLSLAIPANAAANVYRINYRVRGA